MPVQNPAVFLQAGSHPAEDVRRFIAALVADRPGVVLPGDLAVTERAGTANMSVDVASGRVLVKGTQATYQGVYFAENRGTTNLTVAPADATNGRYDLVVAKVEDAAYSGGTSAWSLAVVTGTPAASPVEPAVPANAVVLARVHVTAGATSITNAVITDRRTSTAGQHRATALGGVVVCTATTRPASPPLGTVIWESDTRRMLVHDGTDWAAVQRIYDRVKTTTSTGAIGATETTVLTGNPVTLPAGRVLRLTFTCRSFSGFTANDAYLLKFKTGATVRYEQILDMSTRGGGVSVSALIDPLTAGTYTFSVTLARAAGTGTVVVDAGATAPITLAVEDAGS